jgi:hypothetical protein
VHNASSVPSILQIPTQDTIRRIQRIQAITIVWMSIHRSPISSPRAKILSNFIRDSGVVTGCFTSSLVEFSAALNEPAVLLKTAGSQDVDFENLILHIRRSVGIPHIRSASSIYDEHHIISMTIIIVDGCLYEKEAL